VNNVTNQRTHCRTLSCMEKKEAEAHFYIAKYMLL